MVKQSEISFITFNRKIQQISHLFPILPQYVKQTELIAARIVLNHIPPVFHNLNAARVPVFTVNHVVFGQSHLPRITFLFQKNPVFFQNLGIVLVRTDTFLQLVIKTAAPPMPAELPKTRPCHASRLRPQKDNCP